MSPARALAHWRALRDRPVFAEDGAVAAGRAGEDAIDRVLGGGRRGRRQGLWSGRRVPRLEGRGRVEIDQILLTPRALYVVETKAWSGALDVTGGSLTGRWLQTRRRGGGQVDHGEVWQKLQAKCHVLAAYLDALGARLDRRAIRPVLILWNPELTVPDWLEARPEVVTRAELEAAMTRTRGADGLLALLLRREGETGTERPPKLARQSLRRVRRSLDRLGGYDRVVLHGGRTLTGDLLRVRRSGGPVLWAAGRDPDTLSLRVYPGALGLLRACLGGAPILLQTGRTARGLGPEDEVHFHPAGQPQPIVLPAWHVTGLERG